MIRSLVLPLIAIVGVILMAINVVRQSQPPESMPPVIRPPSAPFDAFVAGSGLVEASSMNIAVGTPVGGVLADINVEVGANVSEGDPLFRVDCRELEAQLVQREAKAESARRQLALLRAGTRPELIPPAEAKLAGTRAELADLEQQLVMWEKIAGSRAASEEELVRRRNAVAIARTRVEQANAELELLKAGTWAPEVSIAESDVQAAESEVNTTKIEIERRIVRAPISGRIIQVNIRKGEYATAGSSAPLMLIGAVERLHIRVEVDEHESWRLKQDSPAVGFVKGNKSLSTPLTFVRFEPFVVPKKSLTGESTERVDTRVMQVLYSFESSKLPVFIGQQMDVYIKADPIAIEDTAVAPSTENVK